MLKWVLLSFLALLVSGCADPLTGYNYGAGGTRQAQMVRYGTITKIEEVKIDGQDSGLGTLGGAAVGGIAGSSVGGGKGKSLATAGGAIAGAVAGKAIEKNITKKRGINVFVRLCSGDIISVVQEIDPQHAFRVGDSVSVLTNMVNGMTRITMNNDQGNICESASGDQQPHKQQQGAYHHHKKEV